MEKSCSLLVHFDKGTPTLTNEIKKALEGNDVPAKIDAMKNIIMLLLNGETLPQLFVTRLLDTFYHIGAARANSITVSSKRPAILADGTYATQSAASETTFTPQTVVQG
ncbi:unnamed protein product [Fraxinus pennsylvanica]|uniref:Uncharacterized protein n=1 Tax=Fraxinus pennsylvanica TaxID=56036 RepID=A0AAD2AGK2_9LAMI|nr:unnamed protein product [Fraxinus pennsylvanica]